MSATNSFIDAVCLTLAINGASLSTMSDSADMWTKSNEGIGNAWLFDTGSDEGLKAVINGLDNDDLINKFFKGDGTKGWDTYNLNSWSMDLITELQSKIAKSFSKDDPSFSSLVSNKASIVQATSGQQTSTGDSQAKAAQSALQNASSAGQPTSNAGDAVTGYLSALSSAQAQITA